MNIGHAFLLTLGLFGLAVVLLHFYEPKRSPECVRQYDACRSYAGPQGEVGCLRAIPECQAAKTKPRTPPEREEPRK